MAKFLRAKVLWAKFSSLTTSGPGCRSGVRNSFAARFAADERGVVAMIFAFLSMAMFLFTGLGIDMARILAARSALIEASDAAALTVGRALVDGVAVDVAKDRGAANFAANVKGVERAGATSPIPTIDADPVGQVVTINSTVVVPLTLLRLTGRDEIIVPVRSEIRYDLKDLEIGVAIDVTGSMGGSVNGIVKMDGMKQAFGNFIDQVLPSSLPSGRKVRIGVAPYAAAVNLDTYANVASDDKSVDQCVTERLVAAYNDAAPGPVSGYFATNANGVNDIDNTQGQQGYRCPTAKLVPLTNDPDKLKSEVNKYIPDGTTGGHLGAQWAWNIIAEPYGTFWGGSSRPESYSQTIGANPRLIKAVILMTDGVNNVAFRNAASNAQQLALCTAMKAKGVRVFSVGFGLTSDSLGTTAKQMLRDCASPGPEYFADAGNAAELDAAFKQFATVLGKLRING